MNKALVVLWSVLIAFSASGTRRAVVDDDIDAVVPALALLLAGATVAVILATRRSIDADRRRGLHLDGRAHPLAWLLASPWLVAAAPVWALSATIAIGNAGDPPGFRPRRIARNAWRIWLVALVACGAYLASSTQLEGDAAPVFCFACIALSATLAATRWMDRADASASDRLNHDSPLIERHLA